MAILRKKRRHDRGKRSNFGQENIGGLKKRGYQRKKKRRRKRNGKRERENEGKSKKKMEGKRGKKKRR